MPTKSCQCGAPRHNGNKCRACYNQYMKDYMAKQREANPEGAKDATLRRVYNITLDQYKALLEAQNGQCAICGTTDPGQGNYFEVDHDHACCDKKGSCGACVRGLLCTGCNSGISRFKDNPDTLTCAAAYVRANARAFPELS